MIEFYLKSRVALDCARRYITYLLPAIHNVGKLKGKKVGYEEPIRVQLRRMPCEERDAS